jgi:hypothetical protein
MSEIEEKLEYSLEKEKNKKPSLKKHIWWALALLGAGILAGIDILILSNRNYTSLEDIPARDYIENPKIYNNFVPISNGVYYERVNKDSIIRASNI